MASINPFQGALGHRRAAHLLRRASYRYTKVKVDEMAGQNAADAVVSLLGYFPLQLDQPIWAPDNNTPPVPWINPPYEGQDPNFPDEDFIMRRYVMGWWVNEALHDPGISHKMALFFHQYMATDTTSINHLFYFDYLKLLHWGSLRNFKKLATKIVTDNSMLRYLNNDQNNKANPNENFAREYLELFTIGKGPAAGPGDYTNYTEEDIVAAARVFTGFNHEFRHLFTDPESGVPSGRPYPIAHDFGEKKFSNRFNGFTIPASTILTQNQMRQELDTFVGMIFDQEETARNFCRRLYRFFVSRHISAEVESDIIGPLAQTFRDSDFEIMPVLSQLLQSEHFFDADDTDATDEILGGLIKSPLELSLQALSFFNLTIPNPTTQNRRHYQVFYSAGVMQRMLGLAGMTLFIPPSVAGYPGYYQDPVYNRDWFNSSTIIARYKLPKMLLSGTMVLAEFPDAPLGTKLDIAAWVKDSGNISDAADPYVLVQDLLEYTMPEAVDNDRFNYFYQQIFLDNLPPADWTYEWQNYINTGNDDEVTIPLERLINAIMYSPEYQTF